MGITVTTGRTAHDRRNAAGRTVRVVDLSDIASEAEPARSDETVLFIESGLRAARASRSAQRTAILKDLALALGCAAGELDFLFRQPSAAHISTQAAQDAANDTDPLIMPDYAHALRGYGMAAE